MRSRALPRLLSLAVAPLAFACAPPPDEAPAGPTWHADVAPLVENSCVRCHTEGRIGPFPLTSYEEVYAVREAVRVAVEQRTMPPWLAAPGCEDYVADESLTDEEIDVISSWVKAGAPEGDPDTAAAAEDPLETNELRRDLTLEMPAAYTPSPSVADQYRCFVLDWPADEERYVTGFGVRPGNDTIVHHVIAYVAPPARVPDVDRKDGADGQPGYDCFGGPGFGGYPAWLGAWAPGGKGTAYPAGTGLRVEPGSKVVLQLHYNVREADQSDRTVIDVQLDESVEREALILPFTNPSWLSGRSMLIEAGHSTATHSFDVQVSEFFNEPFLLHSASMHMHRLGTSARLWLERPGEEEQDCLLDVPRWDFGWQLSYGFEEAKVVYPEDRLGIECFWDNSRENQPVIDGQRAEPEDVAWGEETADEMCLGIFYVSQL